MKARPCQLTIDRECLTFEIDCMALAYVDDDFKCAKSFYVPETIKLPVATAVLEENPLALQGMSLSTPDAAGKPAFYRRGPDGFVEFVVGSVLERAAPVFERRPFFNMNGGGDLAGRSNPDLPLLPEGAAVHSTTAVAFAVRLREALDGFVVMDDFSVWRRCPEPFLVLDIRMTNGIGLYVSHDLPDLSARGMFMAFPYAFASECFAVAAHRGLHSVAAVPIVRDGAFCEHSLADCLVQHMAGFLPSFNHVRHDPETVAVLAHVGASGHPSAAMAYVEQKLLAAVGGDSFRYRVLRDLYAAVRSARPVAATPPPSQAVRGHLETTFPVVYCANARRRRSSHVYRRLVHEAVLVHVRRLDEEPSASLLQRAEGTRNERRWTKFEGKFYEFLPDRDVVGAVWSCLPFPESDLPAATAKIGDLDVFDPRQDGGWRIERSMREATLAWLHSSVASILSTASGFWRECSEPVLSRRYPSVVESVNQNEAGSNGYLYPVSAFPMANEDAIGESSFRVDSVEVLRPEDFSLGAEDVLHIHHGAMSKVHLHGASAAEVLDALAGMLESNPRPGMNGDDIRGHYDRLLALDVDGAMVDDEGLEGLFDGFG